ILTGTDPVFCAGLDLVEAGRTKSITDAAEMLFGGFGGLSFRRTLNKPVIAAVNGPATGGGFELALACDIVVASRDATFALPEVKHGLSPLGGGAANLARVIGYQNAMLLMLTGRTFSAVEMKDLGFVQTIVDPKDVLDTAISLAREIAANSPDAVRCAKAQAKLGLELGWQSANKGSLLLPEVGVAAMFAGSNFREGPRAFKEKRPANWK
ncbi:ClpP/crotonase, partial [Gonapodya prolifera JEL478]